MPRVIELADPASATLEDCSDALAVSGFDPQDEDSLLHAARWLRRLGNNRTFLGDLLVAELAGQFRAERLATAYGPQVIMLARPGDSCFLRAALWPSDDEHMVRASDPGFRQDFPSECTEAPLHAVSHDRSANLPADG